MFFQRSLPSLMLFPCLFTTFNRTAETDTDSRAHRKIHCTNSVMEVDAFPFKLYNIFSSSISWSAGRKLKRIQPYFAPLKK